MKKLLLILTGLIVFALVTPVKAAEPLPKQFIGKWCQEPGTLRDENGKYLGHAFNRDIADCDKEYGGVITITNKGIKAENGCIFTKIKRIEKNSVQVRCKGGSTLKLILSDDLKELSVL